MSILSPRTRNCPFVIADEIQDCLRLRRILFQRMTFVTDDAPPADLLARTTIITVVAVRCWERSFLGNGGIGCHDNAVAGQNHGITRPVGTVIGIQQARVFQLPFCLVNPLANYRRMTLTSNIINA